MGIDQVLVDGGGVAAQEQLGLDEIAVDFAQAGGHWPLRQEPVARGSLGGHRGVHAPGRCALCTPRRNRQGRPEHGAVVGLAGGHADCAKQLQNGERNACQLSRFSG